MKNLFAVFIMLFVSLLQAQNINEKFVSDFKISTENSPTTIKNKNPHIFYNGESRLLCIWQEGNFGFYRAQFFDTLGNKIGNNFPINSNYKFSFLSDSLFSGLTEESTSYSDASLYSLNTVFYTDTTQTDSKLVFSAYFPWCGTGWLGISNDIKSVADGYIVSSSFGGHLDFFKIKQNSDALPLITEYDERIYNAANVACSALPNGYFANFWIETPYYEFDSLIVLRGSFYNQNDSCIAANILIDSLSLDEYLWYDNLTAPSISAYSVSDTSYQLVMLDKDSLVLRIFNLNSFGKILSPVIKIMLPDLNPTISNFKAWDEISVSNFSNGFRKVMLSYKFDNYTTNNEFHQRVRNFIIDIDEHGNLIDNIKVDSTVIYSVNKPFKNKNGEYFACEVDGNDVFLSKYFDFTKLSSTKINQLETGSSETSPVISAIDATKALVTWEDESGYSGQIVDIFGNKINSKIKLPAKSFTFFSDKTSYSIFEYENNNYTQRGIGINKYDADFNLIKTDTIIAVSGQYYPKMTTLLLNDNKVVIVGSGENKFFACIYDNEFNLLDSINLEKTIDNNRLSICRESDTTFYIIWGESIQLFSDKLQPLSERKDFSSYYSLYLGDGKFFYGYSELNPLGNHVNLGKIFSIDGSIIAENISIGNYNNVRYALLKYGNILAYYLKENSLYAKVYSPQGVMLRNEFRIDDGKGDWKRDPTVKIWNDNVFFAWSDVRQRNDFFDIFGKIYKSSEIVTGFDDEIKLADKYYLLQNYPNPFNPSTTIRFSIPRDEKRKTKNVKLIVYDVLGNEVATLVNENKSAGNYEVKFNGNNLASGVFFYRLKVDNFSETKKMLLLK